MISAVKHAASIRNPEFDERQRARRSIWDTPRFLYSYDETVEGDLVLPRGLHDASNGLVDSAGRTLLSMTSVPPSIATNSPAQHRLSDRTGCRASIASLNGDTSVVIAPPGSCKTVIACAAIASRATSTLVLVDRKALAEQWRSRLQKHLGLQMRTDRRRTVRDHQHASTSHCYYNLDRRETSRPHRHYGFGIVDECHHVAASAFFNVLNRIPAKYWLGLTATPERRDGLEDLIYHQLGSHHVTLENPAAG